MKVIKILIKVNLGQKNKLKACDIQTDKQRAERRWHVADNLRNRPHQSYLMGSKWEEIYERM